MIDYHVHTALCNHAQGGMDAYVRRAVDMGLSEICFLDHLTLRGAIHDAGRGLSMTPGEIPLYVQAVQRLKHRYRDVIAVKTGLEIDFNPAYSDLFYEIVGSYAFDVVGSSVHFLNGLNIVSSGSAGILVQNDADELYGRYFEQLEKMLDVDYFDLICHFDLVKKFGRRPSVSFEKEIDAVLSKIKEKNRVVEINTSGLDHPAKEIYPSPGIVDKCYALGINVTLGSDAHSPESIGRHYDEALSLLRASGYRHVTTFTRRLPHAILINESPGSRTPETRNG